MGNHILLFDDDAQEGELVEPYRRPTTIIRKSSGNNQEGNQKQEKEDL